MTRQPHQHDLVVPLPVELPASVIVAGELRERVGTLVHRMTTCPDITDNASFQVVRAIVKDASSLKKTIKAHQSLIAAPFQQVVDLVAAKANELTHYLDSIVTEGKQQEASFLTERDRRIAEEQERFRRAEEAARAAQVLTSRPTPVLTVMPVVEEIQAPITERPDIQVTDESQIPLEFRDINWARVRVAVLSGRIVPGVTKIMVKSVTAR